MPELFDQLLYRDNLDAAWQRVRDNAGCQGCDGISISEFDFHRESHLDRLQKAIRGGYYHPLPLSRVQVPKPSGSFRYLSVPVVRDRVAQTAAYLVTYPLFEKEYEACSHAYRAGRSVKTAILQIKQLRDLGYTHVVDADIDDFFDNIDHDRLLNKLPAIIPDRRVRELFAKWVHAEVYDGEKIYPLTRGIPQGSVVSPMLANLFLDELDENLALFGLKVVRFADDFLVLCKSETKAEEAIEITDYLLEEMDLDLNPLKTKLTSFSRGFKFLGVTFLGDGIFVPFDRPEKPPTPVYMPPPLDLARYLELKAVALSMNRLTVEPSNR